MHATHVTDFYPLVSYGKSFDENVYRLALDELDRITKTQHDVADNRWHNIRERLSREIRTSQYDPQGTLIHCAAWVLMKLNAHAERRFADLEDDSVQPFDIDCSPDAVTLTGLFPNHMRLPEHAAVREPVADYRVNEFVCDMLDNSEIYGESDIQNTSYCMAAEMFSSRNLGLRVRLPNTNLPQVNASYCGVSGQMLELIGEIRALGSLKDIRDRLESYGMIHVYYAILFTSYARNTGRNVSLVPICARHAVHNMENGAILIHLSLEDMIIQCGNQWIAKVKEITSYDSILGTLACVFI